MLLNPPYSHLKPDLRRFCELHQSDNSDDEEAWLLHRDITHALIIPILQIFRRASVLAAALLGTERNADFEIAFRGDARGAFSWLQCFVAEEEDWCVTKGCPGNSSLLSTTARPSSFCEK